MPSAIDTAPALTRCESCGTEFPAGSDRCPECGRALGSGFARLTLALTLIMIFVGFAFTQYIVNLHRGTEAMLAKRWFTRGDQAMQANLPVNAADDYRTALTYDPENRQYRLRLAQALLAANRLPEARAHLVSLWEEEPANGEVNLTLARLHARQGNLAEALRYYSDAINGVWQDEPRKSRIAARLELVRYLMQKNQLARAQAELIALQADAPPDPADQLLLGQLLLQVNEPTRAIEAYDMLLKNDRDNLQASLGKGQALLALGNFTEAERAFAEAVDKDPKSQQARQQLALVLEIVRIDPGIRGLSLAERSRRVAEAFDLAFRHLTSCATSKGYSFSDQSAGTPATAQAAAPLPPAATAAPENLQQLYATGMQKQPAATEKALRNDPDALEPTMQYVFEVERAMAPLCPATEVADRALTMLALHESDMVK